MSVPDAASAHPELWPSGHAHYQRDPRTEARIASLIGRMTIEEKVGQLIQPDIASITTADVCQFNIGSVLNGGSSGPYGNDVAPPADWLRFADELYAASTRCDKGTAKIPIMWGTDAVHGNSNIVGATIFPHNVGLGAMHDPAVMRKIAQITAIEVRVTGQEWTFAPTVAVAQDLRWGRTYESYSSDPELVSAYANEMVRGLQGEPGSKGLLDGPHVLATAKHFLADGGTDGGHDQGDARISETELRDVHGAPYVAALGAGVESIMPSFSSWNGTKMTGNRTLLTQVLRSRMGFDGFLISDWNAFAQVEGCSQQSCPRALLAGVDMFMAADEWKPLWHSLVTQANNGTIPKQRLNEATGNVLRAKFRLGLFDAGPPSSRYLSGRFDLLGSAEHRAVAREAVRKSLVLLKNNRNLLPLAPGGRILVAGEGADDLNKQTGGWTISWQGTGVERQYFPGATSIWEGIRSAAEASGGKAMLSPEGKYDGPPPDAAIVVFGENPYAEFEGDIRSLQLNPDRTEPLKVMQALQAEGIPVVALMLTGRPLWVNRFINASDAFVVAWLPGSEGAGIADVLFAGQDGGADYGFAGSLPFAWPRTAAADGPSLFARGYGLTSSAKGDLAHLSEDSGVADDGDIGRYLRRGRAAAGLALRAGRPGEPAIELNTPTVQLADGHFSSKGIDYLVQEGARSFEFDGNGSILLRLTPGRLLDLSREASGLPTPEDGMLVMTLRQDLANTGPIMVSLAAGGLRLTYPVPLGAADDKWRSYGMPLACFRLAGLDMTRVEEVWSVSSDEPFAFSAAQIARATKADVVLPCPAISTISPAE